MNIFKTMFVICAVLGVCASCSNSYTSQSSPEQGSQQADVNNVDQGGVASPMTSFASQIQHAMTNSHLLLAEQPEASPGQQRPGAMFAPAAPTTTQYLCSCITINPVTAPVHHAPAAASADSFHSAEASAAQSCSSASHHSSEDCPHQHAAQSSPAQEQYAANNGGY